MKIIVFISIDFTSQISNYVKLQSSLKSRTFNMNKLTTSLVLISTMFMAGTTYAVDAGVNARTESGKINFEGKVVGVTCTIKQGHGDQTVKLPDVLRSKLQKSGAVAGEKDFSIDLTGCNAGDTVQFKFTPDTTLIDTTTGNLKNKVGEEFAENIQIQILNARKSDAAIKLNTAPVIDTLVATKSDVSIPFKAQYYAVGEENAVTVGLVQANVGFTLNYK
jgi:type 1 fimbria pilin